MPLTTSVIIPVRGSAPFLTQTLKSIFENSILPDEIIIVDDGMEKLALAQINAFEAHNLIRTIPNSGSGLVDALNTGINTSKSDLVIRIDSDDVMLPERIEIQKRIMEQNDSLVLLGTQCHLIDTTGKVTGKTKYPIGKLNKSWKFLSSCQLAHPSIIMRKESVLSCGGYRKIFNARGMDIAEDFDLWLRLAKVGEVRNLNKFLTEYRQHNNQISSKYNREQLLATIYISSLSGLGQDYSPISFGADEQQMSTEVLRLRNSIRNQELVILRILSILQFNICMSHPKDSGMRATIYKIISKIIRVAIDIQTKFVGK
jgi:glycosyltransferase involved in cell wall biosynthesis